MDGEKEVERKTWMGKLKWNARREFGKGNGTKHVNGEREVERKP